MPHVVDALETAALVAQRDSPTDRRLRMVVATEEAKERYQALAEQVCLAERDFFGDLPGSGTHRVRRHLATIAHRSRELGASSRR